MKIPIIHMASMARSGETLLQRTFEVHPRVHIVANFNEKDSPEEIKRMNFFKKYKATEIEMDHEILTGMDLNEESIILVKQGVWEHSSPLSGFVLVRNPVSIYASLINIDKIKESYTSKLKGKLNKLISYSNRDAIDNKININRFK